MKTISQVTGGITPSLFAALHVQIENYSTYQLEVLEQLTSQRVIPAMPISRLLNAPGNENLKAFFFTPVKDNTVLRGRKIAVIADDGFHEVELLGPVWYFKALGAQIDIVAPRYTPSLEKDHILAVQYLQPVGWVKVDRTADQIEVGDYDAVFIPGGEWNSDSLRYDRDVTRYIRDFNQSGKLIAAVCHAPVVLTSAGILPGRRLTGYWNIQVELKNAGGIVLEEPVVIDGNLITSRHPIDVADFSRAVEKWLTK